MALRTNSAAVREAVRAHVEECCDSYLSDIEGVPAKTPWEALQVVKHEQAGEFADRGIQRAVAECVKGLGLGDFMSAAAHVASWLRQSPEEAASYPNERSEDLYVSLFSRELQFLAERSMPREGTSVELEPYRNRDSGALEEALRIYVDGSLAEIRDGLSFAEAARMKRDIDAGFSQARPADGSRFRVERGRVVFGPRDTPSPAADEREARRSAEGRATAQRPAREVSK